MTTRKKRLLSIGVDPGTKNGAIAIIDDNLNIIYLAKAPYKSQDVKTRKVTPKLNKETRMYETTYRQRTWTDFIKLKEVFEPYVGEYIIYTLEKATVRPEEMEMSSFVNGNSLGIYEGQYSFLNPIAFYEPLPRAWKTEMKVTSDKKSSITLAEKLFNCNLKDYLKTGKKDDVAEALLLAFYGMRMYYNSLEESK